MECSSEVASLQGAVASLHRAMALLEEERTAAVDKAAAMEEAAQVQLARAAARAEASQVQVRDLEVAVEAAQAQVKELEVQVAEGTQVQLARAAARAEASQVQVRDLEVAVEAAQAQMKELEVQVAEGTAAKSQCAHAQVQRDSLHRFMYMVHGSFMEEYRKPALAGQRSHIKDCFLVGDRFLDTLFQFERAMIHGECEYRLEYDEWIYW